MPFHKRNNQGNIKGLDYRDKRSVVFINLNVKDFNNLYIKISLKFIPVFDTMFVRNIY